MRNIKFLAAVGAAAALALSGCSGADKTEEEVVEDGATEQSAEASGDVVVLKVGASPSPHAKILEFVNDELAEEEGIRIEVVEYADYIQPNEALDSGDLDANFFQTVPYLEDQTEERGYEFVPGEGIHLEPLAIYSEKYEDVADVPEGALIGIINDPTNQERALKLLADEGFVELPESGDVNVTTVTPLNGAEFIEVEGPSLVRNLQDVDIAVINGNFAQEGGLAPSDGLAIESPEDNPAVNILVWPADTEKADAVAKLEALLHHEKVKEYILENWSDGSVIAAF